MKRIIIFSAILFAALTFNIEAKGHYHGVSGYFYTELAPYGNWIEIDRGVIVWRPTIIRSDWMPYTMGGWIWTSDGWYWDSYEPFGYITFHYGRWFFDEYYGWLWYPDYEWAPAWVEWRYDNDYIGWAPLNPYAYFSISIGIQFTTVYYTPYYHWHFVTYQHFYDPYVYNYYVAPDYRYRIYSKTKYRTNYGYYNGRIQNRGVDIGYIRTRSGHEIKQRDLVRVSNSKELRKTDYGKRDVIRTLDVNREVLESNNLNRMEIKRDNRQTSLNLEKVEIGQRKIESNQKTNDRNLERNTPVQRNIDVQKTDTRRNTDVNMNKTQRSDVNTKSGSQINNNSTDKNTRSIDIQKKTNTDKRTQEQTKSRTNLVNNNNVNMRVQKNVTLDNSKRNDNSNSSNDVKVEVRSNDTRSTNTGNRDNNRTKETDNSKQRNRR